MPMEDVLLRECVCCKEKDRDMTYLLPCLHATCAKCVDDIVANSASMQRKAAGCSVCGEPFVKDALLPVAAAGKSEICGECVAPTTAVCRCEQCDDFLCQLHADGHGVAKKTHTHVLKPLSEAVAYCATHENVIAVCFCTVCKELACAECSLNEHGLKAHWCLPLEDAVKQEGQQLLKDVSKLAERLPHLDVQVRKLEQEHGAIEASIVTLQHEAKVKRLQIDDLRAAAGLVGLAQRQAQMLLNTKTWPYSQSLRHVAAVAARVRAMEHGLAAYPLLHAVVFDRVSDGMTISDNGTVVTKTGAGRDDYAIANDGCSTGVRNWKVTILAVSGTNPMNLKIGVFNSGGHPCRADSFKDGKATCVGFDVLQAASHRISAANLFAVGDEVLVAIDCDRRTATVHNTTKRWKHSVTDLAAPNPAFFAHVCMQQAGTSVRIEAA